MKQSEILIRQARRYLVGGVNSPVRSFRALGEKPLLIKEGTGSRVIDYDGRVYLDYVLSWGAAILGHAHPGIIDAIGSSAARGLSFGVTHEDEIRFGRDLRKAIPLLERIRFTSSGTEAVMGALRLARGVTQRNKILKFERSYHGHADYLLAWAGSGAHSLPFSEGVPEDFLRHTLIAPYGDKKACEKIFRKHGKDLAAVIVEPVGANSGVVLPDRGFLRKLRTWTKASGSLLVFDEVVTGFRFAYGSAADYFGITPDLICLGKIIGGGLPAGAFGGRRTYMKHLSPEGPVYQASTFAGHPVVMAAGLAALDSLKRRDYNRLNSSAGKLARGLERAASEAGISVRVNVFGSLFSFHFEEPSDFAVFHKGMLGEGMFLAPSMYEANFLSFAHTKTDIEATIKAARRVWLKMGKG
ncbi:MAG: glutamate-1-semialdehyde 2,1-aminomutase [Candidatus Omnitrophota bacterium]